jgi:hypothetical protein
MKSTQDLDTAEIDKVSRQPSQKCGGFLFALPAEFFVCRGVFIFSVNALAEVATRKSFRRFDLRLSEVSCNVVLVASKGLADKGFQDVREVSRLRKRDYRE